MAYLAGDRAAPLPGPPTRGSPMGGRLPAGCAGCCAFTGVTGCAGNLAFCGAAGCAGCLAFASVAGCAGFCDFAGVTGGLLLAAF